MNLSALPKLLLAPICSLALLGSAAAATNIGIISTDEDEASPPKNP